MYGLRSGLVPIVGHPATPAGVKFDILLLCQSSSSKTPERQSERGLTCCMQILIVTAQEHSYCIHALHLVRRTQKCTHRCIVLCRKFTNAEEGAAAARQIPALLSSDAVAKQTIPSYLCTWLRPCSGESVLRADPRLTSSCLTDLRQPPNA